MGKWMWRRVCNYCYYYYCCCCCCQESVLRFECVWPRIPAGMLIQWLMNEALSCVGVAGREIHLLLLLLLLTSCSGGVASCGERKAGRGPDCGIPCFRLGRKGINAKGKTIKIKIIIMNERTKEDFGLVVWFCVWFCLFAKNFF